MGDLPKSTRPPCMQWGLGWFYPKWPTPCITPSPLRGTYYVCPDTRHLTAQTTGYTFPFPDGFGAGTELGKRSKVSALENSCLGWPNDHQLSIKEKTQTDKELKCFLLFPWIVIHCSEILHYTYKKYCQTFWRNLLEPSPEEKENMWSMF